MNTSKRKINPRLGNQIKESLFNLIVDIESKSDAKNIFSDILTKEELEIISKRLAIGYYLKSQRSYENISNNLKVSSTTIANVSKMLKNKGFGLALKKIGAEEWAEKWTRRIMKVFK